MQHSDDRGCLCGHPREAHEHYRSGTDCALCGRAGCRRFRAAGSLRARLSRLLGASFAVLGRPVAAPLE
jgi:hypothetical protein